MHIILANSFISELIRTGSFIPSNQLLVKIRRGPLAYEILKVIILELVKKLFDVWVHGVKVRVESRGCLAWSRGQGAYSVRSKI